MPDQNIEKLVKQTYLKMIENSVGSSMFNSVFVRHKDTGEIEDIMRNGEYSCAFFVSSVLMIFGALDKPYATVATLHEKLVHAAGWHKIEIERGGNERYSARRYYFLGRGSF